jgi:serine/threonine protein phosphatase PrpC
MADVQGLYIVTAVVLVGLFGWVAAVLVRAPTAVDAPLRPRQAPTVRLQPKEDAREPPDTSGAPPPAAAPPDPPVGPVVAAGVILTPTVVVAEDPAPPATASPRAPDPLPPVVVLPPIRNRLDSHPEIQDSAPNATVIVMPEADTSAKQVRHLALVTAVGRSDPEPGKQPERHAVLEQEHLFVFADGAGRKAGADLVGAIALDALTSAFAKDEPSAFVDDPKISARANRVRRAVLAANRLLLKRARAMAFAGLGASGFAAHFSPSNEQLFVAHVGANRAYRLRGGEMTRLTSPQGTRQLGLVERVEVEVVVDTTQPGDIYLFCSDGLGRALGDVDLAAALKVDPSLEDMTKRLIASVSTKDNAWDLVAIVVRVDAAAPPAPAPPIAERKPGRAKTVMGLG